VNKKGTWRISSQLDIRWNSSGRSDKILTESSMPEECRTKLEKLKSLLGIPPSDLKIEVYLEAK